MMANGTGRQLFAEVAPAIPLSPAKSPAVYTYRVPQGAAKKTQVGSRVTIPLGRQIVTGTVLRLHENPVSYPTKPLVLHGSLPLTNTQITCAAWMSMTLHGGLGYTLRLFFPPGTSRPLGLAADPATPAPVAAPRWALVIEKNDERRYAHIRDFIASESFPHRQALILVPEVTMVRPLQEYLADSFDHVSAYHSERSSKQLALVWNAIYQHTPAIVVGTQKALYLPWRHLSQVIVEEEYLDTHKLWDQYPRLDNRDAAERLVRLHGSHLLYSSSVLSPARAYDLQQKHLARSQNNPLLPKLEISTVTFNDRRQGHFLPQEAIHHLKTWLRHQEKIVIMHNQRGSWRTAVCAKCHQVLRCPECTATVFLEAAAKKQRIRCRQCSYSGDVPDRCLNCGHRNIRVFGPGTAKVTSVLRALLPSATIAEITAGRSRSPTGLANADIILGTTALWRQATGLSFDRAVWLFPESTLLYPDYRSSERAWELIARLQKKITPRRSILVVTRYPDLIRQTLATSPEQFMKQLLRQRVRWHYPPAVDLVKLTTYGRSETAALTQGRTIREKIEAALPPGVTIRGPYQGFNKKEGGRFAVHFLLAGPLDKLVPLYKDLLFDRADLSPARIL